MKKHKSSGKTGKAMSNISTAKLHKPSQKEFNKRIEGLEGEHRDIHSTPYTKAKRNKRLEGKAL
jgi:hypothetical protein